MGYIVNGKIQIQRGRKPLQTAEITVLFDHCKSRIEEQVQGLRNCKTPEHTLVCEDFYNERNAELALLRRLFTFACHHTPV